MAQIASQDGETTLTIKRGSGDDKEPFEVTIVPRKVDWLEGANNGGPVSVPQLGIAYNLTETVAKVLPGSPAAEAGIVAGDKLVGAELTVPDSEMGDKPETFPLSLLSNVNWAGLLATIQNLSFDTQLKLEVEREGKEETYSLKSYEDPESDGFSDKRGFQLTRLRELRTASSFSEQIELGWENTKDSLLMVYRFIQKLFEKQVPASALGGPVTIARAAFGTANDGMGTFLMFLTMLSANLAVVNFLPIPLLDGGHMVFLAYEGIFGRPAPERLVVGLHLVGFAFIISLMVFLIGLDFGLIPRNL